MLRRETIGNLFRSWMEAKNEKLPPLPPQREVCENCIKGQCVIRWGVSWLATACITLSITFGILWAFGFYNSNIDKTTKSETTIEASQTK